MQKEFFKNIMTETRYDFSKILNWADIQALGLVEKYSKLDIFDLHSAYKTWNYDRKRRTN